MEIRYTQLAATAALFLSLIAIAMNAVSLSRSEVRAGSTQGGAQSSGELFCINGFVYHMETTSQDSAYGGVEILTVIQELKGDPGEYLRPLGPKACSKN